VGLSGPLVDNDGYPREDIDVYVVRHARHRIICLQNDHKALIKEIEEGLHQVHAHYREDGTEAMDVEHSSQVKNPNANCKGGHCGEWFTCGSSSKYYESKA